MADLITEKAKAIDGFCSTLRDKLFHALATGKNIDFKILPIIDEKWTGEHSLKIGENIVITIKDT